ncbi:MAG: hypothetical protein VCC02_05910 [Myxococcota bacterium]
MPLTISSRFGARAILLSCAAALLSATATNAAPILTIEIGGEGTTGILDVGSTVTMSLFADEIPAGIDRNDLFAISYDEILLNSSATTAGVLWVGTGFSASHNDLGDLGITANRFFMADGLRWQ